MTTSPQEKFARHVWLTEEMDFIRTGAGTYILETDRKLVVVEPPVLAARCSFATFQHGIWNLVNMKRRRVRISR